MASSSLARILGLSWCFKPSQPQRIISGLRETFIKRYIVERTNTAELRPEKESGKAESCREHLWNEIQLKGPFGENIRQFIPRLRFFFFFFKLRL